MAGITLECSRLLWVGVCSVQCENTTGCCAAEADEEEEEKPPLVGRGGVMNAAPRAEDDLGVGLRKPSSQVNRVLGEGVRVLALGPFVGTLCVPEDDEEADDCMKRDAGLAPAATSALL